MKVLTLLILLFGSVCFSQTIKVDCVKNDKVYQPLSEEESIYIESLTRDIGFRLGAARKDLSYKDFNSKKLENADFFFSLLSHAKFTNSVVSKSNFMAADLTYTDFQGSTAYNAYFHGANLCGANLTQAGLLGASFSVTNLSNSILRFSNLSMTNLMGADLTNADLSGAMLVGAVLDTRTLTKEQLSKVGSLYNTTLLKQNAAFITPLEPFVIDTDLIKSLQESHPHLFESVPIGVWFQHRQHFPNRIIEYIQNQEP